jgi:type I restriction enzyme S subunit
MQGRAPEGMDEATAALFPDSFEESELGPVPMGWSTGRLADIASLKGGKLLDKTSFSDSGANPVFGGAGVMGFSDLSNSEGFVITVGRVGAYCGQYFWHQGRAWVNNNASLVSPKNPDDSCWLFLWLKNVDMDLIKKGAAQPFVSNGDISDLKIVLPPSFVVNKFVQFVEPIFKKLSLIKEKTQSLEVLRDTLLPRLISGQLSLSGVTADNI